MSGMEVPSELALAELSLETRRHDEPWIATVRAAAADGLVAELTWDEMSNSMTTVVTRDGVVIVRMERESVTAVRAQESNGAVHFEVETVGASLGGTLNIHVGESVIVADSLLRR